mgnify:FL=1
MTIIVLITGSLKGTINSGGQRAIEGNGASGYNWLAKDDVSLDGLRDSALSGLQDLADWYKAQTGEDLLVTSGTEGDMHAMAERGSHYSGDKLDVASDALENPEFRERFIEYAESKGIIVLDEYSSPSASSTGGHLDLNFQYYKGEAVFGGLTSKQFSSM